MRCRITGRSQQCHVSSWSSSLASCGSRTVLCLGHRTWATVTWPVNELRDNVWVLNQSADVGASFIFAYNPAEWEAVWPNVFLEEGVGITLTPQGCFDQLPMAALQASTKLTFEQLSIIGHYL